MIEDETEIYCKEILDNNPELIKLYHANGGEALLLLTAKVMKEYGDSCESQPKVRAILKELLKISK